MVLKPGLEGVPVTNSGICEINGTEGRLSYRGYPISELAQKSSFLETAFLLIWGELPTENELEKFEKDVQMHRRVSFRINEAELIQYLNPVGLGPSLKTCPR